MEDLKLQKYLIEKTDVDAPVIKELFARKNNSFDVARALIEKHNIDAKELGKLWGDYLGFAYVDPNSSIVNKDFLIKLGVDFIKQNSIIPLYKLGRAVTIATSEPTNPFIQDRVEKKLGEMVSFVFCFPFDIEIYLSLNNIK